MSKRKRRYQALSRATFVLGHDHPDVKRQRAAVWSRSLDYLLSRSLRDKADWAAELQRKADA